MRLVLILVLRHVLCGQFCACKFTQTLGALGAARAAQLADLCRRQILFFFRGQSIRQGVFVILRTQILRALGVLALRVLRSSVHFDLSLDGIRKVFNLVGIHKEIGNVGPIQVLIFGILIGGDKGCGPFGALFIDHRANAAELVSNRAGNRRVQRRLICLRNLCNQSLRLGDVLILSH